MRKYTGLIAGFLFIAVQASSQMFILNEDFGGTAGTTPPAGWTNVVLSGTADDLWHFDNPGGRVMNYPFTEPFAIFDSETVSDNGNPESSALETSLFDASTSNYILLNFVHVFDPGFGGTGIIEAYDGDIWHQVASFNSATGNPEAEIVDLSEITGGITNAKIRFIWNGNGSGFWAVDNIRIYASLPYDGSVVSIDQPNSPVTTGVQDVSITLGNFGYNTITSTQIHWTANGITQPQHNWEGSIGFGETAGNIVIGSYDFQGPVLIKAWQNQPNGQTDLNPYNDTVTKYLVPALCGTYTVGGSNPDFESFSQLASILNLAGVTCPVTFLVRNGIYYDQFELGEIQGVSETNTITFRSESGDSSSVTLKIIPGALKFESMIYLNGSEHIYFEKIGLSTGSNVSNANNAVLINGASHIGFTSCNFISQNQYDYSLTIQNGSHDISIENSNFLGINDGAAAVTITDEDTRNIILKNNTIEGALDWGYYTVRILNYAGNVSLLENSFDQCYRAIYLINADSVTVSGNRFENSNDGVYIDNNCSDVQVSANRFINILSHPNVEDGTSGIYVNSSTNIDIYNNFIHSSGTGPVHGIKLNEALLTRVVFNSVNITNNELQGKCYGIKLDGSDEVIVKNNIFRVQNQGFPVYIDEDHPQLDFDHNNYYNLDKTIGYYYGNSFSDIDVWKAVTGMDDQSLSVEPFFTSTSDLSINQALLNNAGQPVSGIDSDIDGTPRDPLNPDIGASEYSLCANDAGINEVTSPESPVNEGLQQVRVMLLNQGSATLNSAIINWAVNGQAQAAQPWSGSLAEGEQTEVLIGTYDFQPGILYTITVYSGLPNNVPDCNVHNDTINSRPLAVPLCGNYSIGGSNPDFQSFAEAVQLLNLAGIGCPVVFSVSDGTYYELLNIKHFPGTSAENTVTFRSAGGDSTKATLRIRQDALKYQSMVYLAGAERIYFEGLGFITGPEFGSYNNAALLDNTSFIGFSNCYFEARKEFDLGVKILAGSEDIEIKHNRFECVSSRGSAIEINGASTRRVTIEGNHIRGATFWNYPTVKIANYARKVYFIDNYVERCTRAVQLVYSDSIMVKGNYFTQCNDAVFVDDFCSYTDISANRFINNLSHDNAPTGTSAIKVEYSDHTSIYNNFIQTAGEGPSIGINLQSTDLNFIYYNSINIANNDKQGISKGININSSDGTVLKNNIFNVTSSGTPVYLTPNSTGPDFDYNDYFSFDQTVGYYNGVRHTSLAAWKAAVNMDSHSLSVTPFYNSVSDLSINQTLLNGAGVPVTGITTDIEGQGRDPVKPDLGAKEYSLCPNDAGINAVINPVNPLGGGLEDVKVVLQNQGSSALTSVQINWDVNDVVQEAYSWNGNLGVTESADVTIGQYDFQGGRAYVIRAWTSMPNNTNDCNNANDLARSQELAGSLCGTYNIGGQNPDFENFNQAITVLNTSGISCPVTFIVRDGIYYSKFILEDITGTSELNTITFKSESGNNTAAVLRIDPEALSSEAMVYMKGSNNIFFQGLGFVTGSDNGTANHALRLEGTHHITVTGCYFQVNKASDFGISIQAASHDIIFENNKIECTNNQASAINVEGNGTQEITIEDNQISGPALWGSTLVYLRTQIENVSFIHNTVENSTRSIYLYQADSIIISQNLLRNTYDGIYVNGLCSDIDISRNRLINISSNQNAPEGTNGIFILNSGNIKVIDNFVHTRGDGPVIGLNISGDTALQLYYNTVHTTNIDALGKSKSIYLRNCDGISARNNLFSVKNDGLPIHIDANVADLNLDYSNYYHPGGIIGKVDNITYTNLFEWGQVNNTDANSRAVSPYFKADTIPLPYQRILNGSGVPVAGIIYDIDGKLRHNQAPDIGCMEFFVDFGVLELISPTLECYHPDVDSVKVFIRQFGDVPFENLKIAYQMNNDDVHTDTIPGPIIYDFIHTFTTTETITTYGNYLFKIWLIGTLDDNINNDTLEVWRFSKPAPELWLEYDNMCTGWEVYFTGTAAVLPPYYIDGFEWIFGDGDTAYVQNPVHSYTEPGTYEVIFRAYSDAGCYSQISESITIDTNFQALELDYILQDEICLGDGSGRLELTGGGGNPPYNYYLNGQPLEGNVATSLQPGTYEIMVEDAQQCVKRDTVESMVLVSLDAQATGEPLSGYAPLTVEFGFTANDPESWVWHFPDNQTDTSLAPTYTFTDFGYYTVVVEVNSGPPYYCIDTASVLIFADIIIIIDANNVFTPNGDGANDYFEIHSSGIEEIDVKVFNQWGNKIREFDGMTDKWDGMTESGDEAPDGTYYWSLKAKGVNQQIYERQGSVLLLRHGADAYPNPVTDKVMLKTYESLQAPVKVEVYSVYGQIAYTTMVDDPGNIKLDLSHLEGGIYILRLDDGTRKCFVRIIKK